MLIRSPVSELAGYFQCSQRELSGHLLRFLFGCFLEQQRELGFAVSTGIVDNVGVAVALRGLKVERVLDAVGQAGEARLAAGVGADFEVQFVKTHEPVSNMNADFGVVGAPAASVIVKSAVQGPRPPSMTGTDLGSGAGDV